MYVLYSYLHDCDINMVASDVRAVTACSYTLYIPICVTETVLSVLFYNITSYTNVHFSYMPASMCMQLMDSEVSYYYSYYAIWLGGRAVSDVDSAYTSYACDVNLEHLAAAAACGALY